MKTSTKTTEINTPVIIKAIDLELKSLLINDLELFRAAQRNKQAPVKIAA